MNQNLVILAFLLITCCIYALLTQYTILATYCNKKQIYHLFKRGKFIKQTSLLLYPLLQNNENGEFDMNMTNTTIVYKGIYKNNTLILN